MIFFLDFLFQSCSASALQARLKVAAHEAEEESDNIAEDFLEGKTDIDDFLSSFMEKRTVCNILWLRTSDSVISNYLCIRSDQSLSRVRLFATP